MSTTATEAGKTVCFFVDETGAADLDFPRKRVLGGAVTRQADVFPAEILAYIDEPLETMTLIRTPIGGLGQARPRFERVVRSSHFGPSRTVRARTLHIPQPAVEEMVKDAREELSARPEVATVSAGEVGSALALGASCLTVLSLVSEVTLIHPLIGIILTIFGLTFVTMAIASGRGWPLGG